MKIFITTLLLFFSAHVFSQDLVYKPKNPAFGGDTFNYNWLLSSAESQNKIQDEGANRDRVERSEIESFAENLNNQLLSSLSRSLFSEQIGNDGLSEGTYSFGSLTVEIYQSNSGLVVDILDTTTGEQTQVIIPN